MQIFVHDLCYDIKPTGRGISVKKNAQANADNKDITQHIQLLTVAHRSKIRKNFFKNSEKNRKHNAGVNGLYSKFFSAGKKADDQKNNIQDHGDCRQRKRDKIRKNDSKTGNTADRSMARYEEKNRRRLQ